VSAKSKANKRLFAFDLVNAQLRLQLLFYQSLKVVVRVFALIFGDSSENFLIFTKLGKDSVFVCNNFQEFPLCKRGLGGFLRG